MTQPQDAANQLLMDGGMPSIKWEDKTLGHTVVGTIEALKTAQMTKHKSSELDFWPSGDPKMQIIVTIQTDLRDPANAHDDGRRRLYIPPRMMKPVREAIQRVGAPGLAIGGRIAVRWISGTGQGEGNAREFAAEYAPPAVDPGSMLGPGQAAAAPAAPMLGNTAATAPATPTTLLGELYRRQHDHVAATAPAAVQPALGGMLNAPPLAAAPPPQGVDPAVWATLPEAQRATILAAMSNPTATAPPF